MKRIKLTQGQFALVDNEDFENINQYKWCAQYSKNTKSFYALRGGKSSGGKQKKIYMHRFIIKAYKGMIVDHIDHDTLNNQKGNLRIVTKSQNAMNKRKLSNNTSGATGVIWCKRDRKWTARIGIGNQRINLGFFDDRNQAIQARKQAEEKYHGEYSYEQSILSNQ